MTRAAAARALLLLLLLLALLLAASCTTTGGPRVEGGRAVRPGWIPAPNRTHPDFLYVTGSCRDQAAMQTARACAIDNARQQIAQQLGSAVHVKGSYVKDEHSERRRAGLGAVRDYWVLVAYPRREVAKAEARIANRVLLGVRCAADTAGACDDAYAARVESAMTSAGLSPAPKRLGAAQVPHVSHALREAASLKAARVMLVDVKGKFLESNDGEFYSEARCTYRLIDAVSGKVQSTFESGPIKGGHINRKDSVRKALDNCLAKLTARARTLQ
ncbi:MAG: hypothetical protein KC503_37245 [Myxococcales bacterium]|nr:hypothetical protein [Myxococcales bacterium]